MATDTELAKNHLRSVLSQLQEGPLDVNSLSEKLWEKGFGPVAAPSLTAPTLHFLHTRGLVRIHQGENGGHKTYEITREGRLALETEHILPEYEPVRCRD